MLRFCANISLMFTEHAMLDRPAAARRAGFTGIEILAPFDIPAEEWARACREVDVEVANFNAPLGNREAGEVGMAGLAGREAEFRQSVELAIDYAEAMSAKRVNVHLGMLPAGGDREECLERAGRNLHWAADQLGQRGISCMTEALNDTDRPNALLHRVTEALALIRGVRHPNLKIEADLYHMAMMKEDIPGILQSDLADIDHVQFADSPGRHEPGSGSVDFGAAFGLLERIGYQGWISAEYAPLGGTEEGLGWFKPYRVAP